ncbi:MAG: adenosine deaminase [Armatimonadota bacterium]|nr:adenosine deaminase [Armatimonadota bacterium]MDR5696890.1 adenosine deaminase [Armatimonadota bacterium]
MAEGPTRQAIRALPKAELHLHLETSLRLRRLAQKLHAPAVGQPYLVSDPNLHHGYDRLRRLRYAGRAGKVPDSLYTHANIATITYDLLREAASQNIRYVEIRVGGRRGFTLLGIRGMLEAIAAGRERARADFGVQSGTIVTIVRERGPEHALEVAEIAAECRDRGIVGLDIAGDEENFPPTLFVRACEVARDAGLGITVHAGEFSGPASVWTAIYQLGASRIGHGFRAVEDPELVACLREHRITLEICPTSNLRLGLVPTRREHPLRALFDAGVRVTVNSDDPVLLGTSLEDEFASVAHDHGFSLDDLRTLTRYAVEAAFHREAVLEAFAVPAP